MPVKLFEVSDVVLTAPLETSQVGAVNRRRLVALTCDRTSGFEVIHGLLNRIMETLGVTILDESKLHGDVFAWPVAKHVRSLAEK